VTESSFPREYVEELRREAASRRKENVELRAELERLRGEPVESSEPVDEGTLERLRGETDRQLARAAEADRLAREANLDAAIAIAVHRRTQHGLVEKDRAHVRMLVTTMEGKPVEYDEEAGEWTGVEKAVSAMLASYPGIKAEPEPSTRERVAALSSDEVIARLSDQLRSTSNGADS
jgi:hypothetical protein